MLKNTTEAEMLIGTNPKNSMDIENGTLEMKLHNLNGSTSVYDLKERRNLKQSELNLTMGNRAINPKIGGYPFHPKLWLCLVFLTVIYQESFSVIVMDRDDASLSEVKATTLRPTYSITNIQTKIQLLDGVKVAYSSWTKLFHLHVKTYKVLDHINVTPVPKETDPTYLQWKEIDALVLQWIYSTLSDELMVRILQNNTTGQDAWNKLKTNFLNNKGSRVATC
uniref:Retrotransposon Copia-like N-terminal domain-containing protein n=1 Tax=Lactuca sativa TaxID=4236 RepID=A0A9R1XB92_LACSA|nr:hypothetical protein LSAT_V11C500264320 [Lactuca sativa]